MRADTSQWDGWVDMSSEKTEAEEELEWPAGFLETVPKNAEGKPIKHFWIGDVRMAGDWPTDGIPCWREDPSRVYPPGNGKGLVVTIRKDWVSCQPCLELIHA